MKTEEQVKDYLKEVQDVLKKDDEASWEVKMDYEERAVWEGIEEGLEFVLKDNVEKR